MCNTPFRSLCFLYLLQTEPSGMAKGLVIINVSILASLRPSLQSCSRAFADPVYSFQTMGFFHSERLHSTA
jgi:hypothetical protein